MFQKWFDRNNIYPLHFTLYTMTGFWKIETKSKWKRFLYNAYHMIQEISFTFLMCVFIIDAYLVRNDLVKLSTNLCSTITCSASLVKIWFLLSKKNQVDEIRIKLENNLNLPGDSKDDQEILEKNTRDLAMITIIYYCLGIPMITFWITSPLLDNAEERRFSIPFLDFPGAKNTPVFEAIYTWHSILLIIFFVNVLSYDMIFYGFLIKICAHFEILGKNFGKLKELYPKINFERVIEGYSEAKENDSFDEYGQRENVIHIKVNSIYSNNIPEKTQFELIKNKAKWRRDETIRIIEDNINYHREILKMVEDIDDVYQGPVMIQVTCGAALLGVVAYGIIADSGEINLELMQRLFFVGCALFDIMFFCYFGIQMAELSNHVREVLYDIPWHEMDRTPKKLCLFIIARLQKPPKITALKMFPVTLKTYLQLLRVSYNMIAILRQARSH